MANSENSETVFFNRVVFSRVGGRRRDRATPQSVAPVSSPALGAAMRSRRGDQLQRRIPALATVTLVAVLAVLLAPNATGMRGGFTRLRTLPTAALPVW